MWLLEAATPRGHVLVCHGYYANRYQVLGMAEGLRTRGYDVLLFELRGHGSRPGPCTLGLKETEDALAILQWAQTRRGVAVSSVGVLGISMGAAVACHIALCAPQVRAVITDSGYARLLPVIWRAVWRRYHLPPWPCAWIAWWSVQLALGRRLSPWDPARLASQLYQPLLAIHSGADEQHPPLFGVGV